MRASPPSDANGLDLCNFHENRSSKVFIYIGPETSLPELTLLYCIYSILGFALSLCYYCTKRERATEMLFAYLIMHADSRDVNARVL